MLARYNGSRVQGPAHFHGQIALRHHTKYTSYFARVGGLDAKVKWLYLWRHFFDGGRDNKRGEYQIKTANNKL